MGVLLHCCGGWHMLPHQQNKAPVLYNGVVHHPLLLYVGRVPIVYAGHERGGGGGGGLAPAPFFVVFFVNKNVYL